MTSKSDKKDTPQQKQAGAKKDTPQKQGGSPKKRQTLAGGVQIEELKAGNGPVAKAGKMVRGISMSSKFTIAKNFRFDDDNIF